MRSVNDEEKRIVKYIVENTPDDSGTTTDKDIVNNNIIDIICSIIGYPKEDIKYDIEKEQLWIFRIIAGAKNELVAISKFVVPVARIISFLEYLEKMNFIVFVQYKKTIRNELPKNDRFQEVYDEQLKTFFFRNIKCGIFATQHLKDYYSKDYKTVEQLWHEEQIERMDEEIKQANKHALMAAKNATRAIVISIIVAVAGIIANFFKTPILDCHCCGCWLC